MQATKQIQTFTKLHESTQFEVTKDVLLRLNEFNLTPTAKLVLLYLTSCYNPSNPFVFPKVETMANILGLGLTATKSAVNTLIKQGLVLKDKQKRAGNYNRYSLTGQITRPLKSTESKPLNGQNPTVSCIRTNNEQKKEQLHSVVSFHKSDLTKKPLGQEKNEDRTVSTSSASKGNKGKITLDDIPQVVKDKARNPIAYWISLSKEAKEQYIQEQKDLEKKELRKKQMEELRRKEAEEREEERRKQEEWNALPLEKKWSKQQAIHHVWCLRKMISRLSSREGLTADLINLYNLDVNAIINSESEPSEEEL